MTTYRTVFIYHRYFLVTYETNVRRYQRHWLRSSCGTWTSLLLNVYIVCCTFLSYLDLGTLKTIRKYVSNTVISVNNRAASILLLEFIQNISNFVTNIIKNWLVKKKYKNPHADVICGARKFYAIVNISGCPYNLLFLRRERLLRRLSTRPSHYSRLRSQSVLIVRGRDECALYIFLKSLPHATDATEKDISRTRRHISFIYLFPQEEIHLICLYSTDIEK